MTKFKSQSIEVLREKLLQLTPNTLPEEDSDLLELAYEDDVYAFYNEFYHSDDAIFEPLYDIDDAMVVLNAAISEFFTNKQNTFINVSTGAGKTEQVLQHLSKIEPNINVLYLVRSHALANELIEDRLKLLLKQNNSKSIVHHYKGRDKLCSTQDVLQKFKDAKVAMPKAHCMSHCSSRQGCEYIEQFNKTANIRFMTHDELYNRPSTWLYGTDMEGKPLETGWTPNYIIVDEDGVQMENSQIFVSQSTYKSVQKILLQSSYPLDRLKQEFLDIKTHKQKIDTTSWLAQSLFSDDDTEAFENYVKKQKSNQFSLDMTDIEPNTVLSLKEAILKYKDLIIDDYQNMIRARGSVEYESLEQYITDYKKRGYKRYDPLIEALYQYVMTQKSVYLKRIRSFNSNKHFLHISQYKKPANRYSSTPKLYLDATADESIIKKVIPDVNYHSINVKAKDDINIYQLQKANCSKKWMMKEDNLDYLIKFILNLLEKHSYQSVGLITYLQLDGIPEFSTYFANKLNITNYNHFGNLRGSDQFKDVDCLLVVGRYLPPLYALVDYVYAIFGEITKDYRRQTIEVPIRIKNLNEPVITHNYITDEPRLEAVRTHFATAETLQAIGRGRLVHGGKKDVYVFSNDSLGGNIEITGFIKHFVPKYRKPVEAFKKQGYCWYKKSAFKELGFNVSSWPKTKFEMQNALLAVGAKEIIMDVTTKQRNRSIRVFYVYDDYDFCVFLRRNFKIYEVNSGDLDIDATIDCLLPYES